MKNKKLLFILLIFSLIISISTVNAENITSSDEISLDDEIIIGNEIIYEKVTDSEKFNALNCECCSLVIQSDNETVFAFRQDSPLNGHGVEIYSEDWHGMNIIKQKIDKTEEYFFLGIISETGWVVGEGGSQYNESSRSIEQIAATMITNNDISPNYLNQIKNILSRYGYGHFVIKAPNGKYGVAFSDTYLTGTLQKGECLVVPNYYSHYKKVNYNRYSSNPVDAIIIICSYEDSGYNRRNIMTYDYKAHDTENGVFYGVDVFATNDNGRNVGLNTANIVTHFFFEGKYYAPSSIPQNPGKLFVGSHIFENQKLGSVINLHNIEKVCLVGEEMHVYYRVKYLVSARTAVFNLGEDVDFITAVTSHGTYNYNSQEHTLYWQIPAAKDDRDIIITIRTNKVGNSNIHAYIQAMSETLDTSYYATTYGTEISENDVEKFFGGSQRLHVKLNDEYGVALVGEKVEISINGKNYEREITPEGYASIAINLNAGEYYATITYNGKLGKNQVTSRITIKETTFGKDIEKYYKNDTQFYASFLDTNGNPLKNTDVQFNINGVFYNRNTDENGVSKLNINLKAGTYIITTINTATGEHKSNLIVVKDILVENNDLVKYYKNDSQYSIKVLDGKGKALKNAAITFNINGILYTRNSDENGIARLTINLSPGEYIITSQYDSASVSNRITVLERIISKDLSMKYLDGSNFEVKILDGQGKSTSNENLTFNINGILYNRTTDSNGIAKLSINLLKGEYVITTYWNQYAKSNRITIS
jgi:hypothetical protein